MTDIRPTPVTWFGYMPSRICTAPMRMITQVILHVCGKFGFADMLTKLWRKPIMFNTRVSNIITGMYTRTISRDLRLFVNKYCRSRRKIPYTGRPLVANSMTTGTRTNSSTSQSLPDAPPVNTGHVPRCSIEFCTVPINKHAELQVHYILGSRTQRRPTPPHIAKGKGLKESFDKYYFL